MVRIRKVQDREQATGQGRSRGAEQDTGQTGEGLGTRRRGRAKTPAGTGEMEKQEAGQEPSRYKLGTINHLAGNRGKCTFSKGLTRTD